MKIPSFIFVRKKGLFLSKKIERRRNAVHTKNRSFFDADLIIAVYREKSTHVVIGNNYKFASSPYSY